MGTAHVSPLRYPGGKGGLSGFLAYLVAAQTPRPRLYVEPFAGGAGAAVRLLVDEHVEELVLNDLDPGIAAFWRCLFSRTEDLLSLLASTKVTVDEWHRQRSIVLSDTPSELDLGFAVFFLNRTNRSGILGARPIGGLKQTGEWKIDARFNKGELSARITRLALYRNRVEITAEDGRACAERYLGSPDTLVYLDPPYLDKGAGLYLNELRWEDHLQLAGLLRNHDKLWITTYDDDDRLHQYLYSGVRWARFLLAHTAGKQYVGRELAFFSSAMNVPSLVGLGTRSPSWGSEWPTAPGDEAHSQRRSLTNTGDSRILAVKESP